jgi:putative heme-binding domain-containing protein
VQAGETAYFRHTFQLDHRVSSAQLRLLADFCSARLYLNGIQLVDIPDYGPAVDVEVGQRLVVGRNVVGVECRGSSDPAAIALWLTVRMSNGSEESIGTSAEWLANQSRQPQWHESSSEIAAGTDGWSRAAELGPVSQLELGDEAIPVDINEMDDYTQWMQALSTDPEVQPAAFRLAPGFTIELVRAATPIEGSWVSLEFDPRGRAIIAREDRGLLRMTLSEDGRRVVATESIEETLQECRGLLWAYDALYASANNSLGLYRLRDLNGDDRFDEIKLLRAFPGGVGHGRNDLALGPDGLIYSIYGDSVEMPIDSGVFDLTSPFSEHRRHPGLEIGHVLRTDRDGNRWEIVATGMRNPFGLDFNANGDLFTYDADAEFDMGSPWYRPTRVEHIVSGADFGWRAVTGSWPPYFPDHPDNSPPGLDIGKGSPTAVKFGTKSNFPPGYRQALFILDWAYGRIIAVHLIPRGSSYRYRAETVVKGRPLNVTDLAFGPDGSMYVVTGGRKTRAALYRITCTDAAGERRSASAGLPGRDVSSNPVDVQQQSENLPGSAGVHERARAAHAQNARMLRRQLEGFHGRVDSQIIDRAWPHLSSADPWLRYAARIAIEHQSLPLWRDRAFAESNRTSWLTSMMAVVRSGDSASLERIVASLAKLPLAKLTTQQQQTVLHLYQSCSSQLESLSREHAVAVSNQLREICPSPSIGLNRQLAAVLLAVDSSGSFDQVISLLRSATDPVDRMYYLFLLRNVRSVWSLDDRVMYFSRLRDLSGHQGGEGMPGFLRKIRQDAMQSLQQVERVKLDDWLDDSKTDSSNDAIAALGVSRPIVRKWSVADLRELSESSARVPDFNRGRTLFHTASCSACHRVGSYGTAVGPDLTFVSSRFTRRDLLESIIVPSLVVADNYRAVRVVLTDGRVFTGRVLPSGDYRSSSLRLATDPASPLKTVEIEKAKIESHETLPTSWMPDGLLDTLAKDEILDLVAYIESGGTIPDTANLSRERSK